MVLHELDASTFPLSLVSSKSFLCRAYTISALCCKVCACNFFSVRRLRTLSFSVSCNPCICHSYENCRVCNQQFPFWNSSPRTSVTLTKNPSLQLLWNPHRASDQACAP